MLPQNAVPAQAARRPWRSHLERLTDLNGKIVIITGGSGSWGNVLVDRLLAEHEPKELRIVSRGEVRQVEMAYRVRDARVRYLLGDVRDSSRMDELTRGAEVVFHLAALKHVPVCERNPKEAVATNVHGSQVMLDACLRNGVPYIVHVSTDKAVEPINIYGVTKACAERVAVAASSDELRVTCVRAGNVMGSSGSVIPLFLKQILADNEVRITDPDMTRFMLPLPLVIDFLIQATLRTVGGEIQITRSPAMRVMDLAEVLIAANGDAHTRISTVGIRPGEKLDESLVARLETPRTHVGDDYFVLNPHEPSAALDEAYGDLPALEMPEYTSANAPILSQTEIRDLLTEYGLISLSHEAARLALETLGSWVSPRAGS